MSQQSFLTKLFTDAPDNALLPGATGAAPLPKINPNALDNDGYVEHVPLRLNWKYVPGNREFIKNPPVYLCDNTLDANKPLRQPVNCRLIEAYGQAVDDTNLRIKMGINYTP